MPRETTNPRFRIPARRPPILPDNGCQFCGIRTGERYRAPQDFHMPRCADAHACHRRMMAGKLRVLEGGLKGC